MDGADKQNLIEDSATQPELVSANDEQPGPGIDAGMPTAEETAARVRNAGLVDLTQTFNERVANVPREYEVGGKTVYIHSKPIGDIIRLDADAGVLTTVGVGSLTARPAAGRSRVHAEGSGWGYGRELFSAFRHLVSTAEEGASVCFTPPIGSSEQVDTPPDANIVDRAVDA